MNARGGGKLVIHGAKPPGAFHLIKILYIVLLCWRCLLIGTDKDAHCARRASQFAFFFFPSKAPLWRSHQFLILSTLPPPSPLLPFTTSLSSTRLAAVAVGPVGVASKWPAGDFALSLDSLCSHPGCSSSTAACAPLLSVPSPPTSSLPSVAPKL